MAIILMAYILKNGNYFGGIIKLFNPPPYFMEIII